MGAFSQESVMVLSKFKPISMHIFEFVSPVYLFVYCFTTFLISSSLFLTFFLYFCCIVYHDYFPFVVLYILIIFHFFFLVYDTDYIQLILLSIYLPNLLLDLLSCKSFFCLLSNILSFLVYLLLSRLSTLCPCLSILFSLLCVLVYFIVFLSTAFCLLSIYLLFITIYLC